MIQGDPMAQLEFVDWFAGVGGFRIALEQLGLKCVGACDNDKWARETYAKNFGHEPEWNDARDADPADLPDFDIFCGGFPCQSFSIAGKRQGFQDSRGTLFFDICRVIAHKRPSYVFLENVKGLLSAPSVGEDGMAVSGSGGYVFYRILETLGQLGYDVQWQVLNSRDFGVPQSRERVYIIGSDRTKPCPKIFPLREIAGAMAIGADRFRPIGKLSNHQGDRVYGPRCIGPTLDTGKLYFDCGKGLRVATPLERERMQGFPDNWTEGVSNRQRERQTGNAVSVVVVRAIMSRLLAEINKQNKED